MCRIIGYLGEPIALDRVLYEPPHSLERQAHAPRCQPPGRINADGWGVAWYDAAVGEHPARYRTASPMWSDEQFRGIAGRIRSHHVVAAVRDASPGAPVETTGASPFVADQYAFTHNGYVSGFRDGIGVQLRGGLSERRAAGILGSADSEVIFAMVLDLLDKGAPAAEALLAVLDDLRGLAEGKFNFMLSDGTSMVSTCAGNSLFTRDLGTAQVVASEPFDDEPGWIAVPEQSVVTTTAAGVVVEPF